MVRNAQLALTKGKKISSGIYGVGQFCRNWHPLYFPLRYLAWYLTQPVSFTLSYQACQTQCGETKSSAEGGDCIVRL